MDTRFSILLHKSVVNAVSCRPGTEICGTLQVIFQRFKFIQLFKLFIIALCPIIQKKFDS